MTRRGKRRLAAFLPVVILCDPNAAAGVQVQDAAGPRFTSAAADGGIDFVHVNGATPEKYLPETMGGGVVIFDHDGDGWPDIFFVNSGTLVDDPTIADSRHRLYRNNRDGTFSESPAAGDIERSAYGMGACAADVDNDGWTDLYITNFGPDTLYRNRGGSGFDDVTASAGIRADRWSSSCAFADVDNDGDVDLYVANYLDFSLDDNRYCGLLDIRIYCDPNVYDGVADILYRNEGDGTFTDVSRQSGIQLPEGKGLGVVFADYDLDGRVDAYVANDLVANFLFRNSGAGRFEETGLTAGVALGGDGRPMSGMGTDMADMNGDGRPDAFVTNMDRETHNLYANIGGGLFLEVTFESGVGTATLPYVGWGTAFMDYDNDRDLDLAIANGAVLDNIEEFRDTPYPQRNLLLANDGTGSFRDRTREAGNGFALEKVSRGLASGDLDNDGDIDIVIGNNGQAADYLRNDGADGHHSLLVRLIGAESNRNGIGACLILTVGGRALVRQVKAGSSYLGQNDTRVHFGLGTWERAESLQIAWPTGRVDIVDDIDADRILTIREGGQIVEQRPFY